MQSMQILYLYDIKAKNRKEFNRVKRLFYYHLKKLDSSKIKFITKSVILAPSSIEKLLDSFFARFKKSVVVFKARCEFVEQVS